MSEDPAKGRYFIIQAVRWAGVAQVLLGIAVMVGKLDWPPLAGWFLAANGLVDVVAIPQLLARRWRSPKE